ncbi:Fungal transcriptional regulatory protein [Cordyceps javanica]|uniref:Fungal transcriptional regulatory protein n=1 Tax=Cordyceps javanica TaxID=43265 RepID=A0A545UP43_9HYPO|nr:Fungal transcriptional regulatory protein [Cordyceps javanica]TQW02980.1 Fungal transcriptional regulatory protein [Cordyceps javanica]
MSPGSPDNSPATASENRLATPDEPVRPPPKRQRQNDGDSATPQRRQAACQPCRLRKIKCDKKRPVCTICDVGGQSCKYLEDGAEKLTLENVTTTLLQKFEHLSSELAGLRELVQTRDEGQSYDPAAQLPGKTVPVQTPASINVPDQSSQSLEPSRDFLQIPQHPASADTVLCWEVFEDKFPANALISNLFKPNAADAADDFITAPSRLTPLDEEIIPSLVDRFLQNSEISLAEYPDMFPSPPSPIPENSNDNGATDDHSPISAEELELRQHAVRLCNEEESWYYYLTEIALRRIGNRIVNTFFRQGRSAWIMNLKPLLRMAKEFEAQVSSWSAHLPPAMQHYETTSVIRAPHEGNLNHVTRELSWAVDNRLLEMQTWLYQPFLFYFIHVAKPSALQRLAASKGSEPSINSLLNSPPATGFGTEGLGSTLEVPKLDSDEAELLHSLVASGIECCLKTIDVRSRGHRHHGLWYDLRSIMTASLILLAIVKSGQAAWIPGGTDTVWGAMPGQYWHGKQDPIGGKIGKVLTQFDFWAEESPDLVRYKNILEHLVREVRESHA